MRLYASPAPLHQRAADGRGQNRNVFSLCRIALPPTQHCLAACRDGSRLQARTGHDSVIHGVGGSSMSGARKACSRRTRGHSPAASKRRSNRLRSLLKSASVAPRKRRRRASSLPTLGGAVNFDKWQSQTDACDLEIRRVRAGQTSLAPEIRGRRFNHRLHKVGRMSR